MSQASGPTTCLKHSYTLGDATVVVDWRQIKRAMPNAVDEGSAKPSKSSSGKSEKPGAPGKGAVKFASLIQELEAKHIGKKANVEYGYERDGFVVSDEEDSSYFEEDTNVSPEEFFVTTAPTERRKRQHAEVLPSDANVNEEELAKKKRKLQEDMSGHPPEVKEAVSAFVETWVAFTKGKSLGRFPTEMKAPLNHIGQVAMAHHPKGWLSNELMEILSNVTGFSTATIKPRLRKANASGGEGATAAVAGAAITFSEATAVLQTAGGEYAAALELPEEAARNEALQQLEERTITELDALVKAFVALHVEPPKRSPWNDAIRAKIRILFAINDAIRPPPLPKSALRNHILGFWPPNWEVKDSQITPLTRYAPQKPKATE